MFPNINWTLSGVKTVLSKVDATGSVERCSGSGRPRAARSPDTISDVAAEQSDLNSIDYAVWGSYKSVQASSDHGRGRAARVSRRNGTVWTRK